jgi:hypothetical protein
MFGLECESLDCAAAGIDEVPSPVSTAPAEAIPPC